MPHALPAKLLKRTIRLDALDEVLRGIPGPLGEAEPLLLGGVLLAEGWLAVGIRAFVRVPAFRMYDSVARVAMPSGTRRRALRNPA
jgi:hypothetical protein